MYPCVIAFPCLKVEWKQACEQSHSICRKDTELLYSRKVWQGKGLANLMNCLWFTKLKPYKLVLTINNLLADLLICQTFLNQTAGTHLISLNYFCADICMCVGVYVYVCLCVRPPSNLYEWLIKQVLQVLYDSYSQYRQQA